MKWACQFLLCPLSDHLPSISAQSTLNITVPFQAAGMWLLWRYLSKKRFACLRTVMAECPQNRAPRWRKVLLCMPPRTSPLLWIIIMRPRPKSWTFWSCIGGGGLPSAEEERGVSGLHLGIRGHRQLAICSMAAVDIALRPTQIEQKNDTKGTFILLKQCSFNMMNDPHTYFMPKMFHNFISNPLIYIFVCTQYPCTCRAISIVRL